MRRLAGILAAVLFVFGSSRIAAQCVAFLIPASAPVFTAEEGTELYWKSRKDQLLAFPSPHIACDQVKIEEGLSPFKPRKIAACSSACFQRNSDSSRTLVMIRQEKTDDFVEVWISEEFCVPVTYDTPKGLKVNYHNMSLQSAAENLEAIRHAADLKLDSIRKARVKAPEIQNQETFKAEFSRTWSALIEALSNRDWQIEVIDKNSGLVETKAAINKRGETMVCAKRYDKEHRTSLSILVMKIEGGTRVKVNARFLAKMEDQAIGCFSSGTLEREILQAIRENLRPASAATPPR
jgi:hypothetical protein